MPTSYKQLQEKIRRQLDQRTDLGQIIYDYSQDRVAFWAGYYFYASDTQDTSVSTKPFQLYYPLPNGIRNVRMVRLLLGNVVGQGGPPPNTTTTAPVTLPAGTIPVASTAGFNATGGTLFIGSQIVGYASINATNFLGCVTASLSSGNGGIITTGTSIIPAGSLVQQASGVWLELTRLGYNGIYEALSDDVVQPPNQTIPASWAQFGTQLRLYPAAGSVFQLEITGNGSPPSPTLDDDDNFWTEPADAGNLIMYDTTAHVFTDYIGGPEGPTRAAPHAAEADKQRYRLKKITQDLGGAKIFRPYGPGYDRGSGRAW